MIGAVLRKIFMTTAGRWVTGSLIALSLSGAAVWWYNHKEGLRDEGREECIQLVNEETHKAALEALAAAAEANARLQEELRAAEESAIEAANRRRSAESRLLTLRREIEAQRNEDPEYREWADTPLPDGVADRLRL